MRFAQTGWSRALAAALLCHTAALSFATPITDPLPGSITARPLPEALASFSQIFHLQLVYVSKIAAGKVSHTMPAGSSAPQSLAQLLQGTGLAFSFLDERTVEIFERSISHPAAGIEDPAAIQEVIVTATKRREMMGTVPMSISVLSGVQMQAADIEDIGGVSAVTTGVEFDASSQYGSGILTNIAIRGISADKGDATTGIYIDDTPIHSAHNLFGDAFPLTFDLAQVEVLRGPQGVLFGRNTEGGAIRFVTSEPSTVSASQLSRAGLSVTEHGGVGYELGAAAGTPIVDGHLGIRLSAWYRRDGGYVDRVDPFTLAVVDPDANRTGSEAFRLSLAFEPNETLRVIPSISHQSVRLHDSPNFYVGASRPADAYFESDKLLRQPAIDSFTLGSVKLTQELRGATVTSITSFFDRAAAATVDATNVAGIDYFGGYGNPLGPEYPSSYADAVASLVSLHQIQWSEETRIASVDDATLTWLGGIFWSKRRENSRQDTFLVVDRSNPGVLIDDDTASTEMAAFGQARWSLSPRLSLGAGLRLGRFSDRGYDRSGGFANRDAPPVAFVSEHEHLPPTPRFDLTYRPDSHHFLYAALAKGFRNGGRNGSAPVPCAAGAYPGSFAPDSVWSTEVGAKSAWFDRRLTLEASVYRIRWNDIQEHVGDVCGNGFTTNAGAAISKGFDFQAEALLLDRLRVSLAVGMVDVRYTRTVDTAKGAPVVDRGTQVGGVPSVPAPWSGTVTARYDWPIAPGTLYVRMENIVHSHNPGPFSESDSRNIDYSPEVQADRATDLLDLRIGVHRACADFSLYVANALNTLPALQTSADARGASLHYAYSFRPRTLGLAGSCAF